MSAQPQSSGLPYLPQFAKDILVPAGHEFRAIILDIFEPLLGQAQASFGIKEKRL